MLQKARGGWGRYACEIHLDTCLIDERQHINYPPTDPSSGVIYISNSTIHHSNVYAFDGHLSAENSFFDSSFINIYSGRIILTDVSLINSDLYIYEQGPLTVMRCVFLNTNINTAGLEILADIDSSFIKGKFSPNGTYVISHISNTTLCGNSIDLTGGYHCYISLTNCIDSVYGGPVFIAGERDHINLACCTFSGNDTSWIVGTPESLDTSNVYFENPRFCDFQNGDYTIEDISICAPANNNCGVLIGAYDVGCNFGYEYLPGDANMASGQWPPAVIGADVTYLVNYFRGLTSPCLIEYFYCPADINADCMVIGSDVTFLVNYFRGQNDLLYCIDYPLVWPTPGNLPPDAPEGWPNCEISSSGVKTFNAELVK